MANNVVTLDDLDLLFADFVQQQLELDDKQVKISYQQRGQVSSEINKDVVYVKVFQEQDERLNYKFRRRNYDSEKERVITSQTSMRALLLHVVFYGPESDVLATTLNERFYFDSTKQFLHNNNLALIPDLTDFSDKTFEKINSQWWERVDLKLRFYNSITVEELTQPVEKLDNRYYFDEIKIIHDTEGK